MSLFSGCGGMDLGFEGGFDVLRKSVNKLTHPEWVNGSPETDRWITLPRTSFRTVFANDIRLGAKAVWGKNFPKYGVPEAYNKFHVESIVSICKNNELLESLPVIDVITGGFPCQDFSVAGKRNGFKSHKSHTGEIIVDNNAASIESRGMLYYWMREMISIIKPKVFFAENVKGLTTLLDVKEIIENDFRNIGESGYIVIPARVLKAPEYGVPQSRERVVFIGLNKDKLTPKAIEALEKDVIDPKYDPYPTKTHYLDIKDKSDKLLPYVNIKDSINDLVEPELSNDISHKTYSKAKWYGKHCQGQIEVNPMNVGPTIRSEHHGNIEFRRLSADHGGNLTEELEKGLKERRLSVRECARIQTFPDDFDFVNNDKHEYRISGSEAYKLIGNAVPPLLAYHLAKRLEELWPLYFGE
ncbi:MAG: DNA (cytosine-5-)-methyltransferase [Candidatus Kapabacteria bacterium]|nr:DNA (cytosine-5-)-methyltransferase [Candidatus Kapabacteria bacterium]